MSTKFSKIKSLVDKKTDLLVNGYIHECQQLLPLSENYFIIIPISIIEICILYSLLKEEFVLFGDQMEINDDGQTIKMLSDQIGGLASVRINYFEFEGTNNYQSIKMSCDCNSETNYLLCNHNDAMNMNFTIFVWLY